MKGSACFAYLFLLLAAVLPVQAKGEYEACFFPNVVKVDYRYLNETPEGRFQLQDSNVSHLELARKKMNAGMFTTNHVLPDIDFVLFRIPNDIRAFQLLFRYLEGGGRLAPERTLECYFQAALAFAPDDTSIMTLRGNYYYQQDDFKLAESSWLQAVEVNASPEAHYNLGLLFAKQKRWEEAYDHALLAYDSGFPLPGLKRKLIDAGVWRDES